MRAMKIISGIALALARVHGISSAMRRRRIYGVGRGWSEFYQWSWSPMSNTASMAPSHLR